MKNIISTAILIIVISYLNSCAPPPAVEAEGATSSIITTPTGFSLNYNNVNREFSWQAANDYFYQIEHSPQRDGNFITYSTSTNTVLTIPKNISGDFRLKLCAELTASVIECSAPSNIISIERAVQLFIGNGSVFWDDLGATSYRVEQQSIAGDSYQLLQDTIGTSTVLPRPLPYAVRLQSCNSSNNCTLIDERVLDNLSAVAGSWVNTNQEINGSIPSNINAKLTTDYRNRPNQALVIDSNNNWQINYNVIDFALSLWLQPSNISATLIERRVDQNGYWRLDMVDGVLQLRIRQTGTATDKVYTIAATIANNQWQHLFLQYSSVNQTFRIAVNGQIQAIVLTDVEKARVELAATAISIGNSSAPNATNYSGKIDKVQLLNRVVFDNSAISDIMAYDYLANWLLAFHNISYTPVAIAPANTTTLAEDNIANITLSGSDEDGDVADLTYQIATQPSNGIATISGNTVTYIPNANYNGNDSFAFTVTDSDNATSEPAIVNITISPVNDAPSIVNNLLTVVKGTPIIFSIETNDIDGDAVTIESISNPSIGTLTSLSNNQYQYSEQDDTEEGATDSITVIIRDGITTVTEVITFSIIITLLPQADTKTVIIAEDSSLSFILTASDPDGNDNLITYQITSSQQPPNGTVVITGNTAVYTPNADFFGVDIFHYNAVDERGASSVDTTITVMVSAVSDAPVAQEITASGSEDSSITLTLVATDIDDTDSSLSYQIATQPSNGVVTINDNIATYTPIANFNGADQFSYTAIDTSNVVSDPVIANVTVTAVNDAPIANDLTFTFSLNSNNTIIALTATDIDGDNLNYSVGTNPHIGVLSGTAPTLSYFQDGRVTTSFVFIVSDGSLASTATVNIVQSTLSVTDNSETSISLSWNNGSYFKVYRVNSNIQTTLIYEGAARQYTDSGLAPATSYGYQIAYCTNTDTCEPLSAAKNAATLPDIYSDFTKYNSIEDFNTLANASNTSPYGLWSDGTTMWVLNDSSDDKLYAYNLATKARDSSKDFNTLSSTWARGIWSDGTTMWVVEDFGSKVYAYNLVTKASDSSKDFNTLSAASNTSPKGLWSDGTTMWIVDSSDDKLYAYNLATKARDSGKDFNTLGDAGNTSPEGIWSDGTTMWVVDSSDDKLYAYNLATKARDSSKDFNTLSAASNTSPAGVLVRWKYYVGSRFF